jgi:hypothetical protein
MVLIAMLVALVVGIAIIKKVPRQKFVLNELLASLPGALPVIFLPIFILICLAKGVGDIAQVASLTVLYLIIVEMGIFRDLKPKMLWAITKESMALIGAIFIIIYSATALTNYLVTAQIPAKLVHWTTEHIHARWAFLLALNVLLLLTGMVMDIFSAILIVVPLIAPVAHEYDISPYHLGVIFLLNLEIGYLHPPIGLNLFISSFKFRKPLLEVTIATLPFMLTVLVSLLVVTYVPGLTVVPAPTPRDTLGSLVSVVKSSAQAVINVSEVTLPDGTVKKQDRVRRDHRRVRARELPRPVHRRHQLQEGSPDQVKACEDKVIKEWFEEHGTPIDGGGSFEDDEDTEDTEDTDTEDTDTEDADGDAGAGDTAPAAEGGDAGVGAGSGAGTGSGTGTGTGTGTGSGTGSGTGTGTGMGTGTGSGTGAAVAP